MGETEVSQDVSSNGRCFFIVPADETADEQGNAKWWFLANEQGCRIKEVVANFLDICRTIQSLQALLVDKRDIAEDVLPPVEHDGDEETE